MDSKNFSVLSKLRTPFRYSYNRVVLVLICICCVSFALFRFRLFPINESSLALSVAGLWSRAFWQPVTYLFMHGSTSHLFFNMLALLFFGLPVEKAIGSKEFAFLYFVTGILSGIFSALVYYVLGLHQILSGGYPQAWLYQLVGASGAIYGILLTYAVVFPRAKIFIYALIPVPAPLLVILYAAIEFFSQFLGSSNVAHCTHLAGFGFAFLYIFLRMGVNPIRVWKNAYGR